MAARVFISHTDEDIARCAPLLKTLGAWQIPCYFDSIDRRSAQALPAESQQALVDCDVLLRVCTRFTNRSYWMGIEAGALLALQADDHRAGAEGRHKIINLVLDQGYKPEPFDVTSTFVDATNTRWPGWVNDLRRALDLTPIEDIAHIAYAINPPKEKTLSRRAVVGLGVAGAAVVAAGTVGGVALSRRGAASVKRAAAPSPDARLRWWYAANDPSQPASSDAVITARPVVVGATLYVATAQGLTLALSLDGHKLWQFTLPGNAPVYQRPIVANGVLYIVGHNTGIYAVQNGTQLWYAKGAGFSFTEPVLAGDRLYVNSMGFFDFVTMLDATSGATVGGVSPHVTVAATSGVAIANNAVICGGQDGYLYAIDPANTTTPERWRADVGAARDTLESVTNQYYVASLPVVANGVVYVASRDVNVYAIDAATGKRQWVHATDDKIEELDPALSDGVLYVSSTDRTLYALDAQTGALRWKYQTGSHVISAPTVANGVVYIGSGDHAVYALDAQSGVARHIYQTDAGVRAQPTVAGSTLYAADTNGAVYAFAVA